MPKKSKQTKKKTPKVKTIPQKAGAKAKQKGDTFITNVVAAGTGTGGPGSRGGPDSYKKRAKPRDLLRSGGLNVDNLGDILREKEQGSALRRRIGGGSLSTAFGSQSGLTGSEGVSRKENPDIEEQYRRKREREAVEKYKQTLERERKAQEARTRQDLLQAGIREIMGGVIPPRRNIISSSSDNEPFDELGLPYQARLLRGGIPDFRSSSSSSEGEGAPKPRPKPRAQFPRDYERRRNNPESFIRQGPRGLSVDTDKLVPYNPQPDKQKKRTKDEGQKFKFQESREDQFRRIVSVPDTNKSDLTKDELSDVRTELARQLTSVPETLTALSADEKRRQNPRLPQNPRLSFRIPEPESESESVSSIGLEEFNTVIAKEESDPEIGDPWLSDSTISSIEGGGYLPYSKIKPLTDIGLEWARDYRPKPLSDVATSGSENEQYKQNYKGLSDFVPSDSSAGEVWSDYAFRSSASDNPSIARYQKSKPKKDKSSSSSDGGFNFDTLASSESDTEKSKKIQAEYDKMIEGEQFNKPEPKPRLPRGQFKETISDPEVKKELEFLEESVKFLKAQLSQAGVPLSSLSKARSKKQHSSIREAIDKLGLGEEQSINQMIDQVLEAEVRIQQIRLRKRGKKKKK